MKHATFLLTSIFAFALLGTGSALADPFTICVKDKNGKMNRGALGNTPAKGKCQNDNKWSEVTLATEQNVIDVAAKADQNMMDIASNLAAIQDNDADILALQTQSALNTAAIGALEIKTADNMTAIMANDTDIEALQMKTSDNMLDIGDLQSQIDAIATVIGGSTGNSSLDDDDTQPQYMGMFIGRARISPVNVENRIPVWGTLSNLWVRQSGNDDPITGDAARVFTVLLRNHPFDPAATTLSCTLAEPDNEFACADDFHCVDVAANRRISVKIENLPNTGSLATDVQANWSAKFTPGATCPEEP